jgi:hypothetical protein
MIEIMIRNAFEIKDKDQGVVLVLRQTKPFGFNGFKNVEIPLTGVLDTTYYYYESSDREDKIRSSDFIFRDTHIQIVSENDFMFVPYSEIIHVKTTRNIQKIS